MSYNELDTNRYYQNPRQAVNYNKIMEDVLGIGDADFDAVYPGIQGAAQSMVADIEGRRNGLLAATLTAVAGDYHFAIDVFAFCDGRLEHLTSADTTLTLNYYLFAKEDGTIVESANTYDVDGSIIGQTTGITTFVDTVTNRKYLDSGEYKQDIYEILVHRSHITHYPIAHTLDIIGNFTIDSSGSLLLQTASGTRITVADATTDITNTLTVATNKFSVAYDTGNTAILGDVAVNTNKFTVTASSGDTLVAGILDVTGNLRVNTDKFVITATTGNTNVAGTLNSAGDFTVATNLFGVASATGIVTVYNTLIANTTSDIGETGARFGKAWLTNLEITNEPTIGGVVLTEFVEDISFPHVIGDSAAITVVYTDGSDELKISHVTTDGYKHVPSGGLINQILRWDSTGIAAWETIDDTPVNGVFNTPISSNWAFDHNSSNTSHAGITSANTANYIVRRDGSGNFSAGVITATGLTVSAKTRYVSVSGAGFTPVYPDTDDWISTFTGVGVGSGSLTFSSPVNIPHGAIVTAVKMTSNLTSATWTLHRHWDGGDQTMASANFDSEDTSISYATIDNSFYSYTIDTSAFTSGYVIKTGYIKYTITDPYP